jgi:translation elongation factor EF-1beta
VTEIAFTGAGWKYHFLFIFWDSLEVAVIYFLFVEIKNRTLEELADIFRSKNPVAFALKKTRVTVIKDKQGNEVHEIVEKSEAS